MVRLEGLRHGGAGPRMPRAPARRGVSRPRGAAAGRASRAEGPPHSRSGDPGPERAADGNPLLPRLPDPRQRGEPRQMKGARTVSLLKEARNSIRLRHPNIVSVFDVGRINEEFYIAMEFLEGETLQKWNASAKERGKPSYFHEHPKRSLRLLSEV